MHQHTISRLISLRQKLKDSASPCVQDAIYQINEIMFMLLKQEVFMDFMSTNENLVLSKLLALTKSAEEMGDATVRGVLREELHSIMSACLSSNCSVRATPPSRATA
jgi:hypothetical protein